MWDETSPCCNDRKRNGSSRARDEACFRDVTLGAVQDEYDHDDGHGAYWCCGPGNGPVDGIRHSQQILLCASTIGPDHPLLSSWKIHLRHSDAVPDTSSLASLLPNDSGILLLRLDLPLLELQSASAKNAEHVSSYRNGHNRRIQLQCSPHYSAERRFLLRGNRSPHHLRSLWSLVGDEISARYDRRVGGSAPPGSASGQSSPRWERDAHSNFTGPGWRHHCSETWRSSACRRENS